MFELSLAESRDFCHVPILRVMTEAIEKARSQTLLEEGRRLVQAILDELSER